MTDNKNMLDFVKSRLEEGEGISSKALTRLVAAAQCEANGTRHRTFGTRHKALLTAASLALVAAGWFVFTQPSLVTPKRCEGGTLNSTIALLRAADGITAEASDSPGDNLLAWQDAPAQFQ